MIVIEEGLEVNRFIKSNERASGRGASKGLNVIESGEVRSIDISNNFKHLFNRSLKLEAIDVLVENVSRVISAGKIDSGNAKFRRDERDVGKETLRGFETFAGDVSLEVGIVTAIINGVA